MTVKNTKLESLLKRADEVNKKETYEFDNGVKIWFYPIFPERKIENLISELRDTVLYVNKKKIELSPDFLHKYIVYLCIKHFSELGEHMANGFVKQTQELDAFLDAEIIRTFGNEVFIPQEVTKINERLAEFISASQLADEIEEIAKKKLEEVKAKHKDVVNVLSEQGMKKLLPDTEKT